MRKQLWKRRTKGDIIVSCFENFNRVIWQYLQDFLKGQYTFLVGGPLIQSFRTWQPASSLTFFRDSCIFDTLRFNSQNHFKNLVIETRPALKDQMEVFFWIQFFFVPNKDPEDDYWLSSQHLSILFLLWRYSLWIQWWVIQAQKSLILPSEW